VPATPRQFGSAGIEDRAHLAAERHPSRAAAARRLDIALADALERAADSSHRTSYRQVDFTMRLFPILLLSAAAGTSFAAITAQQTPQGQKPTPQAQPTPQARTEPAQTLNASSQANKHDDAFLATWVLTANNNEVALSQLAQQKAQNAEVKAFAQKMVSDHQGAAQKLQSFASGPGLGKEPVGGPGDERISGTNPTGRPTEGAGQTPAGRPVEASSGNMDISGKLDHVALLQEVGRQCLESHRRELEQKQGLEFDRCYMGMAVGMHMAMNDLLTVFQNHASGELKIAFADAQRVVQQHLNEAKQISKRLEGASLGTPTEQPGSGR
jgi:predicted outer membrane protein